MIGGVDIVDQLKCFTVCPAPLGFTIHPILRDITLHLKFILQIKSSNRKVIIQKFEK